MGGLQMTDLEYCDAVVTARKVRDDAILPLLHRVTREKKSKIQWGGIACDGDIFPGDNDRCVVEVLSDSRFHSSDEPVFGITAEVTIGKDGQELSHSVQCVHANAHPDASDEHKSTVVHSSPEYSRPIASFDLDEIRVWYGEQLRKCNDRACDRLDAIGCR
jgi:hypothetical protein